MKEENKDIKQLSTLLYLTEASESIQRVEKELNIPDPSDEEVEEVLGNNVKNTNDG